MPGKQAKARKECTFFRFCAVPFSKTDKNVAGKYHRIINK